MIQRMAEQAEQLKRRTFDFGLRVVRFCRSLRTTWEGKEFSDQLFRAGTRVGANYRAACLALALPTALCCWSLVMQGRRG